MLTSLLVVCPVFGVIVAGYMCGRMGLLGPTASSELNRFVVYLGLPALLFEVTAEAKWSTIWQPGFIVSFSIGAFAMFGCTLLYRVARGHHLADASIDGLNAGYPNTGYLGFPLCEAIFGRDSFALVTTAAILTVSVLFSVAIVFVETGLQTEHQPHRVAFKVARALIRNPLLVAPLLGSIWSMLGSPLPESAENFLHLMGNAASPCALISLGLFLAAGHRGNISSSLAAIAFSVLKLIGQPAVTALCAYSLFKIAAVPAAIAVLLSALPTGTGPYMIAEFYQREAVVTAGTILFTTVASVFTLAACLFLVRHV